MIQLDKKLSVWIDDGPVSGMGHFSRCRGAYEFFSERSKRNLTNLGSDENSELVNSWLTSSNKHKRSAWFKKLNETSALLVDTYNLKVREKLLNLHSLKLVFVLDRNSRCVPKVSNLLQIKLESFERMPRNSDSLSQVSADITGSIFWNSKLEEVYKSRIRRISKSMNHKKKIVITFGGSSKVDKIADVAIAKFMPLVDSGWANIDFFGNTDTVRSLQKKYVTKTSVKFHELNDTYYEKLRECDLLVCGSGTTALEAYHLAIPSLILLLFQNAAHNYIYLQEKFDNAKFFEIADFIDCQDFNIIVRNQLELEMGQFPDKTGAVGVDDLEQIWNFLQIN